MVSPIDETNDAVEYAGTKIKKLQKQLKVANFILMNWDSFGDEYGCSNYVMNELFRKTDKYIRDYIL